MNIGTHVVAIRDINDPISNVKVAQGSEGVVAYIYYGDVGPSKYLVNFPYGRVVVPMQRNMAIKEIGNSKLAFLIKQAQVEDTGYIIDKIENYYASPLIANNIEQLETILNRYNYEYLLNAYDTNPDELTFQSNEDQDLILNVYKEDNSTFTEDEMAYLRRFFNLRKSGSKKQAQQEEKMDFILGRPPKFTKHDANKLTQEIIDLVDVDDLLRMERNELEEVIKPYAEAYREGLELDQFDFIRLVQTVADFIGYEVRSKKRTWKDDKPEVEEIRRDELPDLHLIDYDETGEDFPIYDAEDFEDEDLHYFDIPKGSGELWFSIESFNGFNSLMQGIEAVRSLVPSNFSIDLPEDYFTETDLYVSKDKAKTVNDYIGTIVTLIGPIGNMPKLYHDLQTLPTNNFDIDLANSELLLPGGTILRNNNYEVSEFLEVSPVESVAKHLYSICAQLGGPKMQISILSLDGYPGILEARSFLEIQGLTVEPSWFYFQDSFIPDKVAQELTAGNLLGIFDIFGSREQLESFWKSSSSGIQQVGELEFILDPDDIVLSVEGSDLKGNAITEFFNSTDENIAFGGKNENC